MSQPATDGQDAPEVVEQFAKALTTKGTKVHEGNAQDQKPSWYFVSLVVQAWRLHREGDRLSRLA